MPLTKEEAKAIIESWYDSIEGEFGPFSSDDNTATEKQQLMDFIEQSGQ